LADPEERLRELDAVFSALSHRARRQILMTLWFRGGEMSAGDIAGRFAHAWPTTTRHLKVLEEAGLVSCERQAQARLYRIDAKKLKVIEQWIEWFDKGKSHG
jgi:DNA-binding transcriptional ArsR family regulator